MPQAKPIQRILIIRPSALGDVCRTVPVLVSLKREFSDAQIDWLVQDSFAPAIASHPDLGRVIAFPRSKLKRFWTPGAWSALTQLLGVLRKRGDRYDMVLDCQGLLRSGLLTLWTGAPKRIGYADASEMGWIGLTHRVDAPKTLHAVDRMLRLASAAGARRIEDLRLYTSSADRLAAAAALAGIGQRHGTGDARYAVLAPTTRWPGKLWPMERYAELTRRLLDDPRLGISRVVLTGMTHERSQCSLLLSMCEQDRRIVDAIGRTDVGSLMALIEGSSLVVGSDSAAIHMAVGFNRPIAALYGPTRIETVGPFGRSEHVLQQVGPGDDLNHKRSDSGRALMARISVEDVLRLVAGQLMEKARTREAD